MAVSEILCHQKTSDSPYLWQVKVCKWLSPGVLLSGVWISWTVPGPT